MSEIKTTSRNEPERAETPMMLPPVDVIEDATGITLYADLPGVPMEKQTQTKNIEKSSYSSPTLNYFGAVTHLTAGGSQSVKESPVAQRGTRQD